MQKERPMQLSVERDTEAVFMKAYNKIIAEKNRNARHFLKHWGLTGFFVSMAAIWIDDYFLAALILVGLGVYQLYLWLDLRQSMAHIENGTYGAKQHEADLVGYYTLRIQKEQGIPPMDVESVRKRMNTCARFFYTKASPGPVDEDAVTCTTNAAMGEYLKRNGG